ncbi:hypothetical protein HD806DRAFT_435425 [Xylariaceae sp. AK1471]|nr:hypothetical protein HD806DRAFT_435425 [Xylariaceae sp. AK1471]
MSSRNIRERRFIEPPPLSTKVDDTEDKSVTGFEGPGLKRRQANVYDAVAGRVTTTLPLNHSNSQRPLAKHYKRHAPDSRRDPTLAPEEVLFKRSGAPVRYAEKDIYLAHEHLCDGGRGVLPDSDLLKTIHSYVSHFYGDLPANKRTVHGDTGEGVSERSMDETALLAFGLLLEEASLDALGKKGDLVFTEGVEVGERGGPHSEDEDAEVFGFKDVLKYETRGRLKRPRASTDE